MEHGKTIVLLDLWTDANRGDCALQLGLIAMVRDRWPGCKVHGIFRFGANELAAALEEVPFTSAALDGFCGGLRRTYYSGRNLGRFNPITGKLMSLYSFVEMAFLLSLYKIGLRFLVPQSRRTALDLLSHADVVLWKGKNFRDYGGFRGINRQLTLLSAGMLAAKLNRNVHCVNASVWPMRNILERKLVQRTFSRCRSISVREPGSLNAAERMNLRGVHTHFAEDLSFYHLQRLNATGIRRKDIARTYDVALTVTRWGNQAAQQKYLETLRQCIRALAAAGARSFVVIPQVTRASEDSSELVAALAHCISTIDGVTLHMVEGSPDIPALLSMYEQSGLLIGTRMHSCVFAVSVGTPFVAIAYDTGPKWDILKQFWPERFVLEYESESLEVVEAAVELFKNPSDILASAAARFRSLAESSFDNVRFI